MSMIISGRIQQGKSGILAPLLPKKVVLSATLFATAPIQTGLDLY
jgi:hypothetical protein